MSLTLTIESQYWQQNRQHIAGIDEVGRGCLAGPVVAAAVIFAPNHQPIEGINDSKKLSPLKRSKLAEHIKTQALYWRVSFSSVSLINQQGIVPALYTAMDHSLISAPTLDAIIIDGRDKPRLPSVPPHTFITTLIKGDSLCYSIAAASIIAKVARDHHMQQLHHTFPHYNWFTNKGYGTRMHRQAILTHGICEHHRTLFVRKVLSQSK